MPFKDKDKQREAVRSSGRKYHANWVSKYGVEYCRKIWRDGAARQWRHLRRQIFDHYGWECACRGCETHAIRDKDKLLSILSVDHIDGGGNAHRRSLGVGANCFYTWLRRSGFPPGFRTLCGGCNMYRQRFGGDCPLHGPVKNGRRPE